MIWQPIFEIQDGGRRQLKFSKICSLDVTVMFYVRFWTLPSILVEIGLIAMIWQPIFKIQDGDRRHLEFP